MLNMENIHHGGRISIHEIAIHISHQLNFQRKLKNAPHLAANRFVFRYRLYIVFPSLSFRQIDYAMIVTSDFIYMFETLQFMD